MQASTLVVPTHTPRKQESLSVHALPSLQAVPSGAKASAGHATLSPSHTSAGSQVPFPGRHTVPASLRASGGQLGSVPLHASVMSHSPVAGRQTVPPATNASGGPSGRKASAGQLGPEPLHVSGRSHAPAAGRHWKLEAWNMSLGQEALAPVHASATSQSPADGRQTRPTARNSQSVVQQEVGSPLEAPRSHCSPGSSTPSPQPARADRESATARAHRTTIFVVMNASWMCVYERGNRTVKTKKRADLGVGVD